MSGGWIPAWRKLFEREDWMRPTKRNPASYIHAWLDLCQMAQHRGDHVQGEVRLKQGEVLVAIRPLAKRWGWSKSSVSRFIERAKRGTMIGTVRGTPQGTVYRIVKYGDYAIPENHLRDTSRDDSRDTSGTAAGQEQQRTTNQLPNYTSDFEDVWQLSRRGSKKAAYAQYRKAVPVRVTHDELLTARMAHVAAAKEDRYVKHLERWIKDERWEEDVPSANGSGALHRPML